MGEINEENKLLSDIHAKLMPDISEILSRYSETLVQNLQILNENITQKLEKASTYAKLAIETICRNRLEEYNHFRNSLNEISKQIDHMSQNKKQVMENYKKFGKVCGICPLKIFMKIYYTAIMYLYLCDKLSFI